MAVEIKTPRGSYRLAIMRPAERGADGVVLTLNLERVDGMERVALQCCIAQALAGDRTEDSLLDSLAVWIAEQFEIVREAAFKSVRAERKLHQVMFNQSARGPF